MEPFATVEDYEARYGEVEDEARVTALLQDATNIIASQPGFAKREGARYIIKGVRSIKDFEYEREQADINRRIGGIETLLLYAEPQYESVSSSMVRELIHFGRDVSEFLPSKLRVKN